MSESLSQSLFKSNIQAKEEHVQYFSTTKPVSEIIKIQWRIENFSYFSDEVGISVMSPKYASKQKPEIKWFFQFYPNGQIKENKEYCSLFLNCEVPEKGITVKFTFALLGKHNLPLFPSIGKSEKEGRAFDKAHGSWGFPKFIKRVDLMDKKILVDDSLTIASTIHMDSNGIGITHTTHLDEQQNKPQASNQDKIQPKNVTSEDIDIGQFFESDKFSDITLITEAETFNAHKVILCSASTIFQELFENLSPQSTSLFINDIPSHILKEVLRYIYTNKVHNLSDIAYELVDVAQKYQMMQLKKLCENSLCNYLMEDNLLDMLLIAESCNLSKLYEAIGDLFITHRTKFISTQKFKDIKQSNPAVIANLFALLVAKNKL